MLTKKYLLFKNFDYRMFLNYKFFLNIIWIKSF